MAKINTIEIELTSGEKIQLSVEAAKELRDQLNDLFGTGLPAGIPDYTKYIPEFPKITFFRDY